MTETETINRLIEWALICGNRDTADWIKTHLEFVQSDDYQKYVLMRLEAKK